MKSNKWFSLVLPAALIFAACSENVTKSNAELQEGSVMLKGVTSSIFDVPSSVANESSSVGILEKSTALSKAVAIAQGEEESEALAFYTAVPATIHLAEAIKDSVRLLIEAFASEDLPETYEGLWGEYSVKLLSIDSLGKEEEGKLFRLTMSKDGEIMMHLQYRKNSRNQYRGACYFQSQEADSTKLLLRFNTFNEGVLGKRMTIWISRSASTLENPNDPTIFRFHAVQTPAGRVMVSGITYHPEFDGDDFWMDGAKVYGFRAVSDVNKNHAILRVAFGDAEDVDGNFFMKHALDKAILGRATQLWKEAMLENDTIARAVSYSMEKKVPLSEIIRSPALIIAVWAYQAQKPVSEFSSEDLKAYLDVNAEDILAGEDKGMKILYYHVKVKQPIFLSSKATIVGYQSKEPTDFAVEEVDLEGTEFDEEMVVNFQETDITADAAEEESDLDSL